MTRDVLKELMTLLEQSPNEPFILFAIAQEYVKREQPQAALEYYSRLVASFPNYTGTYYHLGKLYEKLGQVEKAISTYQSGMNMTRSCGDVHAFSELQSALSLITDEEL